MQGDILATLPQDLGKTIRFSHDHVMTVESSPCDVCGEEAKYVVQGETDSFGFEPIAKCPACYENGRQMGDEWLEAGDVEDREPRPGHVFWVSEGTNHDGHGDWCRQFRSFREATGYYRQIEQEAAPWCGLYPDNGVREIPEEEAKKRLEARQRYIDEEWEAASKVLDPIQIPCPEMSDAIDDDYLDDDFEI